MLSDFPCRKHLSFLCGSARLTCLAAGAQLRRILHDALKSCCFYLYECVQVFFSSINSLLIFQILLPEIGLSLLMRRLNLANSGDAICYLKICMVICLKPPPLQASACMSRSLGKERLNCTVVRQKYFSKSSLVCFEFVAH